MPKFKETILSQSVVKSYRYGDTLELTTSNGLHKQTIKVLPNKRYVVLETGEILDMNTTAKTRNDNLKAVKNTMRRLRRLIAHNFKGKKNELWVTLTYRELITDTKIVYRDFKIFIKRLRKRYPNLEYINVIEPQASGSWHCHLLLKDISSKNLFIPNSELANAWKKGFTKTKRLKSSDKVGNYVVAYLSNLKLGADNTNQDKKYIKGARLYLYPKGVRIYRCSKGIKKPVEMTGTKEEVLVFNGVDKLSRADYVKKSTHQLSDGEEISYLTEFYNRLE